MSEITKKTKSALSMAFLLIAFDVLIRTPLWFALLGYLVYQTGAGFFGWLLLFLYIPSQIIAMIMSKLTTNALQKVEEEKNELETNDRFIDAKRTN